MQAYCLFSISLNHFDTGCFFFCYPLVIVFTSLLCCCLCNDPIICFCCFEVVCIVRDCCYCRGYLFNVSGEVTSLRCNNILLMLEIITLNRLSFVLCALY